FGLFVDGDVQGLTDQREADWHDVRSAACVGGRQMRHSLTFEEAAGWLVDGCHFWAVWAVCPAELPVKDGLRVSCYRHDDDRDARQSEAGHRAGMGCRDARATGSRGGSPG